MVTNCNFYGGAGININNILRYAAKVRRNFKNNKNIRKITAGLSAFAVVFSIMATVLGVTNLTSALSISVNGSNYGYVRDEQAANDLIDSLQHRYVVAEGVESNEPVVNCTPTVVPANSIVSSVELADKIVEHSDEYINAITVFVNGNLFARADSIEAAQSFIYGEVGDSELYNDIELRESIMSPSSFNLLPDFSEVCYAEVPATVDYHVYADTTSDKIRADFTALGARNSVPQAFLADSVLHVETTLPALAVKEVKDYTVDVKQTAYESGTKAGTLSYNMRSYSVCGVEYYTEEISQTFTEKYADKPVATSVKDVGKKGFCWPVDTGYTQYTSSYWGDNRDHKGYDIACKTGTPILAVYDGYVESVNSSGSGYGLHFVIKHPNGVKTLYSHCSKLYVSVGDKIERGEVVGLVGTTGKVTGSHLHFEVRKGNAPVNPMNYIGKR